MAQTFKKVQQDYVVPAGTFEQYIIFKTMGEIQVDWMIRMSSSRAVGFPPLSSTCMPPTQICCRGWGNPQNGFRACGGA